MRLRLSCAHAHCSHASQSVKTLHVILLVISLVILFLFVVLLFRLAWGRHALPIQGGNRGRVHGARSPQVAAPELPEHCSPDSIPLMLRPHPPPAFARSHP
jgi:hypothetical protein